MPSDYPSGPEVGVTRLRAVLPKGSLGSDMRAESCVKTLHARHAFADLVREFG
jgi:hypothetical protein